jgi:hypothetical protein
MGAEEGGEQGGSRNYVVWLRAFKACFLLGLDLVELLGYLVAQKNIHHTLKKIKTEGYFAYEDELYLLLPEVLSSSSPSSSSSTTTSSSSSSSSSSCSMYGQGDRDCFPLFFLLVSACKCYLVIETEKTKIRNRIEGKLKQREKRR